MSHIFRFAALLETNPFRLVPVCAALLAVFIGGCSFLSPEGTNSVVLGELFELSDGQTVRVGRNGPLLTFQRVETDSRCPTGSVCVWQGEASISLRVLSLRDDTTLSLTIPGLVATPYEENTSVSTGGYRFKLLELTPYPEADHDAADVTYSSLLRVEKE